MSPLVECVPNFSEGRRSEVVMAIVDVMRVPGVAVLDVSSDPDHNRSVVTLAGDLRAIEEAAFRGVEAAAQNIDMRRHQGVHPRIGAADVVPLIPLRDVTLAECADAARRLGVRIGAELAIPVYLYEAAALRPDRTSLPQVRRDSYERLATTITTHSDRTPDYGPNVIGSAGAVAIGARGPLIAFNAYLDTANLEIAQSIAREIRESNGGLPRVRALGLLVGGTAQVSMNLIDFRVTGLLAALEAVIQKAESHGTRVVRTELVGLVPLSALVDAALSALQLPRSAADLILETRIGRGTGDYRPIPFE